MQRITKGLLTVLFSLSASGALAGDQDYLEWAGITEAHKISKGSGVTIALLNAGLNYNLPEFFGRIAKDAQGNYGYDAINNSFDPMELFEYGTGTQVASIAAGNEYGIAPEARIVPVRVFDENGVGGFGALANGVKYAVERAVDIIEIGGGPLNLEKSAALCDALKLAEAAGILVVVPAGNSASLLREYPTGCVVSNVLVVASVDPQGDLTSYSNFGFPAVHIAAPAENIWRVSRDGSVQKDGRGSSLSAAFATGVAALVKSAHPSYSPALIKISMVRGAVEKNSLRGKVLANGYLHAVKALKAEFFAPRMN